MDEICDVSMKSLLLLYQCKFHLAYYLMISLHCTMSFRILFYHIRCHMVLTSTVTFQEGCHFSWRWYALRYYDVKSRGVFDMMSIRIDIQFNYCLSYISCFYSSWYHTWMVFAVHTWNRKCPAFLSFFIFYDAAVPQKMKITWRIPGPGYFTNVFLWVSKLYKKRR